MKKRLLQLFAALLSAAFVISLWPPFGQNGNAWFALVPLLLLVRQASVRWALALGWVSGFVAWVGQLWWMLALTDNGGPWPLIVPALLGLSAVLACFVAAFAGLAAALRRRCAGRPGWARIGLALVVEPALWAGLECLRANLFTGFAWNPLGLACAAWTPLLQTAALGGAALTSAVLVAANGAIATLLERLWWAVTRQAPTRFAERLALTLESILPLAVVLAAFVWGVGRIRAYDALSPDGTATVVVERTDVPCVFARGETYTPPWLEADGVAAMVGYVHADLWLWPESALAGVPSPMPAAVARHLARLAGLARAPLLMGGLHRDGEGRAHNAALLLTADGPDAGQVYAKRHLVPFGEYIPFDKAFPALQRLVPTGASLYPGERVTAVRLPSGLTVGPLICFEDTVAEVARQSVNDGARVLVNMSNDAWYAPSAQPAQHAQQAILRCVETGVPMFRSTNRGDNTAIDAVGRAVPITLFPTRLPLTAAPYASLYLRYGELVFGAPCALFVLCLAAWLLLARFLRRPAPVAAPLALLCLLAAPAARARSAQDLLPTAGMALDDGNVSLAEKTASAILSTLGISSEERARAQEILIRADLERGDAAGALARIEATPELPAERRLALSLAAYNLRQDFAKTEIAFAEAAPSADTPWGVAALRLVLQADLELGRSVEAAERFAAVDAAKGADARARAENALLWVRRFPNPRSRAALLAAAARADLGGVYLECALALPEAFAEAEDRSVALAALDRLLAEDGIGSTIEARLALAAAALDPDAADAVSYARRAVEVARAPEVRQAALAMLGDLLCDRTDDAASVDEGLALLDRAVRLDPSAADAPALQLRIAETLARIGRMDDALAAYDRWIASYDLPALRIRVRQGRGRVLLAAGRADEALAAFDEALALADTATLRHDLMVEAVDAAIAAGRHARAETLCRDILAQGRDPAVSLRLARALEATGDVESARKAYADTRDDPAATEEDAFVAAMRLGALMAAQNRPQEAIAEFTRFLPRAQGQAHRDALLLERGRTYYALGRMEAARDDFAAVSAADPGLASEARFFTVLCLYGLGDDDRARTLAQEYVAAYPDSKRIPDMLLWIAKSDFNRGDYAAAGDAFLQFADRWPQEPRVPTALYLAARAAFLDQDYAHAVERVSRLAQAFPQAAVLADARFLQAEALIELARHGEAVDLLTALVRRSPNAAWVGEAYGRLGDCLLITATDDPGRYAQAIDAYREALARLDSDPDASVRYAAKIGRANEKRNRLDEAAEQYTRLLYRAIADPGRYAEEGRDWIRRAATRLRAIEVARGNRAGYETLSRRLRAAGLLD